MSNKTLVLIIIIFVLLVANLYFFIFNNVFLNEQINSIQLFFNILTSIGGLLLFGVTFLYLLETRKSVSELKKQREISESPAVTVRIVPDKKHKHLLNVLIRNTGNWPAYDVKIKFDPDLPYYKSTLNNLSIFKYLPVLEKGESIEFFFDSAKEYFASNNPKNSNVTISYFNKPLTTHNDHREEHSINYPINLESFKGQLTVSEKDFDDLVTEIQDIKHALVMLLTEREKDEDEDNDKADD